MIFGPPVDAGQAVSRFGRTRAPGSAPQAPGARAPAALQAAPAVSNTHGLPLTTLRVGAQELLGWRYQDSSTLELCSASCSPESRRSQPCPHPAARERRRAPGARGTMCMHKLAGSASITVLTYPESLQPHRHRPWCWQE